MSEHNFGHSDGVAFICVAVSIAARISAVKTNSLLGLSIQTVLPQIARKIIDLKNAAGFARKRRMCK
jgi:hypothetical protein